MKTVSIATVLTIMRMASLHAALVVVLLGAVPGTAADKKGDIWKVNEHLARRVAAELQKTKILRRECDALTDVLGTLRDIEMYPVEATQLTDENILVLDKAIEKIEKDLRLVTEKIDGFDPRTSDALQIMREMVVDEPIESMFAAIEDGNLARIALMLDAKHEIDTLWQKTDSLIEVTRKLCGAGTTTRKGTVREEDEFFRIIRANLGMQNEEYLAKIKELKMQFLKRATRSQKNMMGQIDLQKIKMYLAASNIDMAETKCEDASALYQEDALLAEVMAMMVKVKLLKKEYVQALKLAEALPDEKPYDNVRMLYRMQCNYNLQNFDKVLADTVQLRSLAGVDRNFAIWLILESGLACKQTAGIERFVILSDNRERFAAHILHALSRVCVVNDDDSGALKILHQGTLLKVTAPEDRSAVKEMELMTAEVHFELKNYVKAGEIFYRLLKEPEMFERSLSGIVWCYMMSGQYEKAEMALKKLINQAPEHYSGAEGILTLSRRYYQKAKETWDRWGAVDRENVRIEGIIKKLNERKSADTAKVKQEEIGKAFGAVRSLQERLQREKLPSENDIRSYYENIEKLCLFVKQHYYTGTFQELSFTKSREAILDIIDSALAMLSQDGSTSKMYQEKIGEDELRMRIKKVSDEASLFSVIALIDKYRWEQELLIMKKKHVNRLSDGGSHVGKDSAALYIKQKMMDSLLNIEKSMKVLYVNEVEPRIRAMLKGNITSEDASYLWYQLGELYYQNENMEYSQVYEAYEVEHEHYEKKREQFRKGELHELSREPVVPRLDHGKSMNAYRQVLSSGPATEFAGGALYGLAWCFNDLGKFDSAFYYMDKLAGEYPDNPHSAQARMYCGEFYFDKGDLEKALASFHQVMKYPESEWFDEALYKVAWTQYRMSNPEKAISSFLALVDLGYGALGRSVLEKESMDYIAISFSEIDISGQKGLQRAVAFVKKLGDKQRGCQILHRLAQVYREQGRYEMSRKTYELILASYPDYEKNPKVEAELLAVQERDMAPVASLEQKYEYFSKYNRKAKWAIRQDDSTRNSADSVAMKMLYDAGIGFHQLALQGNSDSLYYRTISAYRDFINMYQKSPVANECHYNLAEIQFSLGNYYEAAEEFMAVSRRYPDSKYKETAAWNAIVASQNILKREQTGK